MKLTPTVAVSTTAAVLLFGLVSGCGNSKIAGSGDASRADGNTADGRARDAGSTGGAAGAADGGSAAGGQSAGGTAGTASSTGGGAQPTGGTAGTASSTGGGTQATGGNAGGGGIVGGRSGAGGAAGGSSVGGNGGAVLTLPVNLRTAGTYVILAKSGISTVPPSVITGNLGVSPATATAITMFSLMADSTNLFSTSAQVTGKVYAADYATPTPSDLTTAIGDMELAYTDAASRPARVTELGAGNIGGMTITPGVYKWGTGVLIPTNITLTGGATAVWIFEIAQGLTVSSGARVNLTGGAVAKNVFWQVAGGVVMGTTAHLEGIVLSQTSATLATGTSVKGRILVQTAVTLDTSTVVEPAP